MKPVLILIQGPPASGKSTLAKTLSDRFNLPLLARDSIKESLFDFLGIKDVEWSKSLGGAAFDLFFQFLETLAKTKSSIIVEGAFHAERHRSLFQKILADYPGKILEVYVVDDATVLLDRFKRRWESGERHRGHQDGDRIADLALSANTYPPLRLVHEDEVLYLNGGTLGARLECVMERLLTIGFKK